MSRQRKSQSRKKQRQQEEPQPSALREYFLTIVVCTVIALFVTTYVVHPMSVPTPSMEPTILVGDRLLIDKFTIRNGYESGLPAVPIYTVRRQDIVVCKAPREPEILLVKRVIGIPTYALNDNYVTVTPVQCDLTDYKFLQVLESDLN